jgi:hypothetical protein
VTVLGGRVTVLGGRVTVLGGRVTVLGGRVTVLGGRVTVLGGCAESCNEERRKHMRARVPSNGAEYKLEIQ